MCDVIIIGAGLSGLVAARDLQRAGLVVKVVEARNRIGGKSWSVPIQSGKGVVDMGAAWVNMESQKSISKLIQEFRISTISQNIKGKVVHKDRSGKVTTHDYGALPSLASELVDDITGLRDLVEELTNRVDLQSWSRSRLAVLAGKTLAECVLQVGKTEASMATAQVWTRALLGVEPHEVSGLFFLDYCKSAGGLLNIRADHGQGAQAHRLPGGTQEIARHLAACLRPDMIELDTAVKFIDQGKSSVVVRCSNGRTYEASRIIMTIPSTLYSTIRWQPELPDEKQHIVRYASQGYYTKVILVYSRPWWRALGLSGLSQSFDHGPICVTRDTSDERNQWSLTCFIVGAAGRAWSSKSYYERMEEVYQHLQELFGSNEVREPEDVLIREWSAEEFSQGAPCPVHGPDSAMNAHQHVRSGFLNAHFAGTETAYEWKGYMDGAVSAGLRAAAEVKEHFQLLSDP